MKKVGRLYDKDREKVVREIEQLQGRVIQTLVPTILAFGLVAFAGAEKVNYLSLGGIFAVLFTSSLYVAATSYKIFKNSAFLQTFDPAENTEDTIYYENINMLARERKIRDFKQEPPIIKTETTTASVIYAVLALTFFYIFYMEREAEVGFLIATSIGTTILLLNSFIIFMVYVKRNENKERWEKVKDKLKESG
jgi:cell division protein FtsL